MPAPALADSYPGSYSTSSVDIQASVQADGSLVVIEQRTIQAKGDVRLCWDFEEMLDEMGVDEGEQVEVEGSGSVSASQAEGAELRIDGVQIAELPAGEEEAADEGSADASGDAAAGEDAAADGEDAASSEDAAAIAAADLEWAPLGEAVFIESWRDEEEGPGYASYSLDSVNDGLYVFLDEPAKNLVIEVSYTVTGAVEAYEDVGELYWRYLCSSWDEDAADVTATIELPVPDGESDVSDEVYVWGHGPSEGTVSVTASGTVVCEVDEVPAGQYAEAHLLFPVDWLATSIEDESRLDEAVEEEDSWVDEDSQSLLSSLTFVFVVGIVCVALLVWALWAYVRFGREYSPEFTDKYLREPPDDATHPAVLGRLWRWDHQHWSDFSSTFLRVIQKGYVRAELVGGPDAEPAGAATSAAADADAPQLDCRLTLSIDPGEVPDSLDAAMLRLLFEGELAQDGLVSLAAIEAYAAEHPDELNDAVQSWQDLLSAQTAERDFFEASGRRWQRALLVVALLFTVVGVASSAMTNNLVALAFVLPTAAALLVVANYLPRRSREGNELIARCKALRNWLRDLPEPPEQLPQDAQTWAELLVYAFEFGVGSKLLGRLRKEEPQLFSELVREDGQPWPQRHVAWLDMDGRDLLLALDLLSGRA